MAQRGADFVAKLVLVRVVVKLGDLRNLVANHVLLHAGILIYVVLALGGRVLRGLRLLCLDIVQVVALKHVQHSVGVSNLEILFGVEAHCVGLNLLLFEHVLEELVDLVC